MLPNASNASKTNVLTPQLVPVEHNSTLNTASNTMHLLQARTDTSLNRTTNVGNSSVEVLLGSANCFDQGSNPTLDGKWAETEDEEDARPYWDLSW